MEGASTSPIVRAILLHHMGLTSFDGQDATIDSVPRMPVGLVNHLAKPISGNTDNVVSLSAYRASRANQAPALLAA